MAASSSDINPYVRRELSTRLLELLEGTRQAWLSRIVSSNRPAEGAALYLPFKPEDEELVQEIENIFNKKSHHCYVGVFFRGHFRVGEKYDTVILPLEKVGIEQARPVNGTPGQALNWDGQEYFVVTRTFGFSVDGGKLAGVVVAFKRDNNDQQE
ncbi:hypothetical protein BDW69DRAFT_186974 [Aspergillus filifer]